MKHFFTKKTILERAAIPFIAFLCLLAPSAYGQQDAMLSPDDYTASIGAGPSQLVRQDIGPKKMEQMGTAVTGLSDQEQGELNRVFKFQFKGKQSLLQPYASAAEAGIYDISKVRALSEDEKLYRYFGIAAELYKKEKYTEAVDILKFIAMKRPDDGYVKDMLLKALEKSKVQDVQWGKQVQSDASKMRAQRIARSLQDGIDYYKQKQHDLALYRFSDVLVADPDNKTAKDYIGKIKDEYFVELDVERLVSEAEEGDLRSGSGRPAVPRESPAGAKGVSEGVSQGAPGGAEAMARARGLLDRSEVESTFMDNKLKGMLNDAEIELKVNDVILDKSREDMREEYFTLGPGDVMQISVLDHPELSGKAVVRLEGDIVLPLVNDVIKVKSRTLQEVTEAVRMTISRYVRDPRVQVAIEEYKSKMFFVIDETGCTPFPISRANLTLRDALFISDWGDHRALGRVIVMKPHKLHPIIRKVDAFSLIYRGNLSQNVRIEDGDVIYIPLTYYAKISKSINDTLRPFAAIRNARNEWINQKGDLKSYIELPKVRQVKEYDVWGGSAFPTSFVNS